MLILATARTSSLDSSITSPQLCLYINVGKLPPSFLPFLDVSIPDCEASSVD